MQTDRSEGRTQMNPVRVASECQCWAALQFQQELCSFFFFLKCTHDQLRSLDRFFFKISRLMAQMADCQLACWVRWLIRKGLKIFKTILIYWIIRVHIIFRVNYTLALLKRKILIDLNQPVTLSLSHGEMLKGEFKNTHKYISLDIFTEKRFFDMCQNLFS